MKHRTAFFLEAIFRIFTVLAFLFLSYMGGWIDAKFEFSPLSLWISDSAVAYHALVEQKRAEAALNQEPSLDFYKGNVINGPGAFNGYTILTTAHGAALINMDGKIIYQWGKKFNKDYTQSGNDLKSVWRDAKLLSNGDVIFLNETDGTDTPYGLGLSKIDKNSNLIWNSKEPIHHRISLAQDGSIYALSHKLVSSSNFKDIHGLYKTILDDSIVHLSADGKKLDEVFLMDLLIHSPYKIIIEKYLSDSNARAKWETKWDILHSNSAMKLEEDMAKVFPMFQPEQVLVSLRNLSLIILVDMQEKRIVWGKQGIWKNQHDVTFSKDGTLLIYDNLGKSETASRILRYNPTTDTTTVAYEGSISSPFFSSFRGVKQELPNGNLLITETHGKRVFEVNSLGQIVWQLKDNLVIQTAFRYAPEELSFLNAK